MEGRAQSLRMKVICIGGGAASFFFAAELLKEKEGIDLTIIEQGKSTLNKVLISGGGRCNVTHQCFDPKELVQHYPRGQKELLGPFYQFGPEQTLDWFAQRGVKIIPESDGRMFPASNTSQTIVNCLQNQVSENSGKIWTQAKVIKIDQAQDSQYEVVLNNNQSHHADVLFIGTGSSPSMWKILSNLGHSIIQPVPSLFTFKINDNLLSNLSGISLPNVEVSLLGHKLKTLGPLLITHRGLSGPAILKLSAWGARQLHQLNYQFEIKIDWLPQTGINELRQFLNHHKNTALKKIRLEPLAKRLLHYLIQRTGLDLEDKLGSISDKKKNELLSTFKSSIFSVHGKNTFKEEFVTAGGIELKEINFKSFSSKLLPSVYMAGEVLNIDAVTGGFNFQAAWTGAYIAAQSILNQET